MKFEKKKIERTIYNLGSMDEIEKKNQFYKKIQNKK